MIAIAFMVNCIFFNPTLLARRSCLLLCGEYHADFARPRFLHHAGGCHHRSSRSGRPANDDCIGVWVKHEKTLKDNILIRKIDGAETAGSLNILFSDKTGTITKGALQVVDFISPEGKDYQSFASIPDPLREMLLINICGNTNAIALVNNGTLQVTGGNATERALHEFVGVDGTLTYETYKMECEDTLMFNSANKYSASVMKGAPESGHHQRGAGKASGVLYRLLRRGPTGPSPHG